MHEGSLQSIVYNDGEISTCGQIIEVLSIETQYLDWSLQILTCSALHD